MNTIQTNIFILGAGIAGCTAALNLAGFCRVIMIDRNTSPQPRAGESLPPAANNLLKDMGLWEEFCQQQHLPNYGNQSHWGGNDWQETDFLRDPSGHGWHLDRQKFELWLQQKAVQRGSLFLNTTQLKGVEQLANGRWRLHLAREKENITVEADVLIDASGRNPHLAKRLGGERKDLDKLVCGWFLGTDEVQKSLQGLSYIQADEAGWWYTAPTPNGKRILSFHTDSDNTAVEMLRTPEKLLAAIHANQDLEKRVSLVAFRANPNTLHYGTTAAHSAITQPFVGEKWLTVGDAALSFDPLSSQGIFNALYTGLAAAESCYRYLQGQIVDFSEYEQSLFSIFHAYQNHLSQWYSLEKRWQEADFWKRRSLIPTRPVSPTTPSA
ncbi:MAG: tryptophan 7-halogenase [Bacteroidia bacterium]